MDPDVANAAYCIQLKINVNTTRIAGCWASSADCSDHYYLRKAFQKLGQKLSILNLQLIFQGMRDQIKKK